MLPRDPKSHIPVPPLAGRRALLLAAVSGDGKLLAVSSPGRVERPSGHRTAPFFFDAGVTVKTTLLSSERRKNKTKLLGRGKLCSSGHFLCAALVLVLSTCPGKRCRTWPLRARLRRTFCVAFVVLLSRLQCHLVHCAP